MTENIGAYMEQVARHYWGEPTGKRGTELRWGTHGSRSVDLRKGTWYDHENKEGGGVVDLVKREAGATIGGVSKVLEREFGISREKAERLRPVQFISRIYEYYDADGCLAYQVVRYEPKDFRQRRPDDQGGWIWSLKGIDPLPYNLPAILASSDEPIFIVEGEKCADALIERGILATTNSGGAKNWNDALDQWFAGRNVVLLPDNDGAGHAHMDVVQRHLQGKAHAIKRVNLPGLEAKEDVADWLLAGNSTDELNAIVRAAKVENFLPEIPDSQPEIQKLESDATSHINGNESLSPYSGAPPSDPALPPPYETLTVAALRALPPVQWTIEGIVPRGALSALYGQPGAGKSFAALDMALAIAHGRAWQGRSTAAGAALYIAGEGVGGLGARVRAWQAARGYWRRDGADPDFHVLPLAAPIGDAGGLDRLLRTIDAIGARFEMIVIDTVARAMAATGHDENDATEMGLFVAACDAIAAHTGAAVIAVHHSGKDAARGLRGSSAFLGAVSASIRATQADGVLTLAIEKQKDGEQVADIELDMVRVGIIGGTSIVPQARDIPAADAPSRGRKIIGTGAQYIAWQALSNLAADLGARNVSVAAWHEAHKEAAPDVSPKARSDARAALQNKGAIVIDAGHVHAMPGVYFVVRGA